MSFFVYRLGFRCASVCVCADCDVDVICVGELRCRCCLCRQRCQCLFVERFQCHDALSVVCFRGPRGCVCRFCADCAVDSRFYVPILEDVCAQLRSFAWPVSCVCVLFACRFCRLTQ